MFNRDALFGKKDEAPRNEPRPSVNVTPGLGGANPPMRPQPAESPKPDLRFAEVPKAPQAQAQPRADEPSGSRLIVGPDIKLKGVEITDCDTLVVEGRVEASMDSRVIQIAENGVFSGSVSIDVAEIRGRFEGELTARKQLVIYSTGRVSGEIRYGTVRIEEGGELSGMISTLAKAPASASTHPAAAAQPTPAPTASAAPAAPVTPTAAAPAAPPSSSSLTLTRPTAPATPEAHPAAASASREPAPSRPPKGGKSNNAGVNPV